MSNKHAARSADGRYSNFGHSTEAKQRELGRYPITRHVSRSVGAQTGKTVRSANKDCDDEKAQSRLRA